MFHTVRWQRNGSEMTTAQNFLGSSLLLSCDVCAFRILQLADAGALLHAQVITLLVGGSMADRSLHNSNSVTGETVGIHTRSGSHSAVHQKCRW